MAKEQVILVKCEFRTQEWWEVRQQTQVCTRGTVWSSKHTPQKGNGVHPFPFPQLKPGVPLPSPEDLRGKILIKNKKNQFSGPASPSCPDEQKPGGEPESNSPSGVPLEDDTGERVTRMGWGLGGGQH